MSNTTIKDIARECNISTAVASAAFRNKKGTISYSAKTREKVLAVAREMGYTPNPLGQSLRSGTSDTLALMFNLSGTHNPSEVPRLVSRCFWEKERKKCFIINREQEYLAEQLSDYRRRNMLGIALEWRVASERPLPTEILTSFPASVLISATDLSFSGDQIIWDRGKAIREAVDYLMKSGRKHPALLCGKRANPSKCNAFYRQLEKYNLNPGKHHVFTEDLSRFSDANDCYALLESKFKTGDMPFDAFVCGSDDQAIATMFWLRKNGYQIPGDVAVVGFNNAQITNYQVPRLASADRKHREVANKIYELLSSRIINPKLPERTVQISMEFIWKESAG